MHHFRLLAGTAVLALHGSAAIAAVSYSTVTIGNAGNAADTAPAGRGAVGYDFRMGKYEVTNAQYVEFLNAVDPTGANARGLFNASMGTDVKGGITLTAGNPDGSKYAVKPNGSMTIAGNSYPITYANKPVNFVSYLDAQRMSNWLTNGQGSADTETGIYTMSATAPAQRNAISGFFYAIPTIDEWHKAAYYDATNATYYDYATGSNTLPNNPQPPALSLVSDPGGSVNFRKGATSSVAVYAVTQINATETTVQYLSDVGDYANSPSLYGTFDQNGNVGEMIHNGAAMFGTGGAYTATSATTSLGAGANLTGLVVATESAAFGFRLMAVPEPTSMSVAGIIAMAALCRRRARD